MNLYFYTPYKNVAATSLVDLQAMILALADQAKAANVATINRVTSKVETLVQSDSGEPLSLFWYDDAATVASWVTDATITLACGLGDLDPITALNYASTTDFTVSGSSRVGTLPLNTNELEGAMRTRRPFYQRTSSQFYLHIRKTSAAGISETVALLPVQVSAGVLNTPPVNNSPIAYVQQGSALSSGLTMPTNCLLGRTTAGTGAIEAITVGNSLSLSGGTLDTVQDIRTTASPTWANPVVTSLSLGATTPGVIGGSGGALTFTAAGTNQNVTITPSGTAGDVVIPDNGAGTGRDLLIGTTSSSTLAFGSGILVQRSGTTAVMQLECYDSSSATGPSHIFIRARGTLASPAAITTDDALMSMSARGYYGGGTPAFTSGSRADIGFYASESWSDSTHNGTYLRFRTTPSATGTAQEMLRLTSTASSSVITGGALNMTFIAGTGNSRTMTFQTTTSGGVATTALTLNATQDATFAGKITALGGASFLTTSSALTNGAGVAAGTLLTAPTAGNPTKWIGINDNGTTRYIPAW